MPQSFRLRASFLPTTWIFFSAIAPIIQSAEVTNLSFIAWTYNVPGEHQFYDKLSADFAAATRNVTVHVEVADWKDAHERIQKWVTEHQGPDLVIVPDIWLAEFAEGIEPLGRFIRSEMQQEFSPVLFNRGLSEGKLLGLVWATSTKALFYRKDLFRQAGLAPPRTWQEQLNAALKLNDPPLVHGLGLPGKRDNDTDDNFYFYFWSAGGKFFDEHGRSVINSEAGIKALQFYVDLINKHHLTQAEVTSWHRNEVQKLFEAGKLAMFATGPWCIESLRKTAPTIEFGVVPLPIDQVPVTQIVTDHVVLLRHSTKKAAAASFLNFAYQDKYRLDFARLGLLPEKTRVAADGHFQKDAAWKVFVDIIPLGRSVPLMRWQDIGTATREAMYQAITGRKTVRAALDELAQTIDQIVAKQSKR